MFRFEDDLYTRDSMLAANCDDCELCAWLESAQIGDTFSTAGAVGESTVECVS